MNRLYFYYSPYDEDGVINAREFKETALAAYEHAIRLAPHEAILHYHRGQLLEQLGRFTEAVSAFLAASSNHLQVAGGSTRRSLDFLPPPATRHSTG